MTDYKTALPEIERALAKEPADPIEAPTSDVRGRGPSSPSTPAA